MKKFLLFSMFLMCASLFGQTIKPKYTYYVKFNKLLTTTKVDTLLYKPENFFEYKVKGEFKDNADALTNNLNVGDLYSLPMKEGVSLIAIVKIPDTITTGSITTISSYMGVNLNKK